MVKRCHRVSIAVGEPCRDTAYMGTTVGIGDLDYIGIAILGKDYYIDHRETATCIMFSYI